MFLTHLHPDLFLQIFHLLFHLCDSVDHLTSEDQLLDKNSRLSKFGEVKSSNRTRNMEVEPQRSILSFIIFNNTLQDADMERNMLTIDRQKNRVTLIVNVDEVGFEIPWQVFFVLVAVQLTHINHLLLFQVIAKLLIYSFLKFL